MYIEQPLRDKNIIFPRSNIIFCEERLLRHTEWMQNNMILSKLGLYMCVIFHVTKPPISRWEKIELPTRILNVKYGITCTNKQSNFSEKDKKREVGNGQNMEKFHSLKNELKLQHNELSFFSL